MARVEELLSVQELINYTKTRKLKETMGDLLFPTQKIEGLEIKMIKVHLIFQYQQVFMLLIQKQKLHQEKVLI